MPYVFELNGISPAGPLSTDYRLVRSEEVRPYNKGMDALVARMRPWALNVLADEKHGPGLYQVGFGAQHECGYSDNELAIEYIAWDGQHELQLAADHAGSA